MTLGPRSRAVPVTVGLPPAPDAILTAADVAAWLKITPRQVQRLGVPCVRLGPRTSRYFARDVLTWLEAQRQAPAPRRRRPRWPRDRRPAYGPWRTPGPRDIMISHTTSEGAVPRRTPAVPPPV